MRSRNASPDARPAELVGDDGFAKLMRPPGRRRKRVRIAYRLQEQQEDIAFLIVDHMMRDLADSEIGFVADGNKLRETDAPRRSACDQAAKHAAALRYDGYTPRNQLFLGDGGIRGQGHVMMHVDQAD